MKECTFAPKVFSNENNGENAKKVRTKDEFLEQ